MQDIDTGILLDMVSKDYVIFGPRSKDDLKRDYAELFDYPELTKISPQELLFVWWYSCQSSPIIHLPEEKRFPAAVDKSFKGQQREERKQRYAAHGQAPALPPEIKSACKVMNGFNPGMRITMALNNLYLLRECDKHIRQENRGDQSEREDYLKTAALARKIQGDILKDIERGNHGVDEVKNTVLASLEGVAAQFHKNKSIA